MGQKDWRRVIQYPPPFLNLVETGDKSSCRPLPYDQLPKRTMSPNMSSQLHMEGAHWGGSSRIQHIHCLPGSIANYPEWLLWNSRILCIFASHLLTARNKIKVQYSKLTQINFEQLNPPQQTDQSCKSDQILEIMLMYGDVPWQKFCTFLFILWRSGRDLFPPPICQPLCPWLRDFGSAGTYSLRGYTL